ncbi:MAG TPA: fused MFS/spermidine synthase [Polyangia bacterium]|jgi:Spermidine synthase|nr:fused MFS/spermidine synthase [Polyangia bacterium]
MTDENPTADHATSAAPRFLPLVLLLFLGSGCAALIYEIVWFQLLQLVIGSTAVSLGVLLGTFMGGMCLGSFALPRVVSARAHPLRVYALMELAIGLIAILVLVGVPAIAGLYAAAVGYGLPGILLRAAVCALCLLPPTLLMGATLPAISRWIETTPEGISWLGFFYGGNIAGAVLGSLLAGFYLLRVHGTTTATCTAVAINAAVAGIAFTLARRTPHRTPVVSPDARSRAPDASTRLVYLTIALSGMSALGAEVVWTRLLSLMLGATVYTFSIILAVFLVGLGIGSSAGSYLSRRTASPRIALAWCQMLLVLAIAWTACMLTRSIPYWPINPTLSQSPGITFQIDFVRCFWAILPAACLWGASFPLALAAAASRGQDPGRLVGGIYAANTVGAIIGALGFSMLVIPAVGTQQAQRLLIALAATAAVLALASSSQQKASEAGKSLALASKTAGTAPVAIFTAVVAFLIWSVAPIPPGTVGYGRFVLTFNPLPKFLYVGEGMNASVAVSEWPTGVRTFHVSGKVEASTAPMDMRLQAMLGHLPAHLHGQPRSVLIVGFGAGITAGSFVPYPSIRKIVICEIEPLIPKVVSRYFGPQNHHVLDDPRTEVVYDDARHYILTTDEKFDIITSDPVHPWVKGAATLYTKEYFDLVRRHLNPGGLVTQWVPLYESNTAVVKSEIATFLSVFPHTSIWGNTNNGQGYDTVLLGKVDTLKIDLNQLQQRADRPDYAEALTALIDAGFKPPIDLLGTFAGQASDLGSWLANAEINHDRDLRLQYLAGFQLNLYQGEPIYREILKTRKFPGDLFVGSDDLKQLVANAMATSRQNP